MIIHLGRGHYRGSFIAETFWKPTFPVFLPMIRSLRRAALGQCKAPGWTTGSVDGLFTCKLIYSKSVN